MKETLQITKEREVLSLVTGVTYAIVPTWYGGTYKDLKMDLIIPKNRENHPLCPAVVWICGGAFLVMDRSVWMPEMMFYAEKGYVVACVDYRTSNEVAFPAQLEDVKAAVRFLKAHAQQFCIDPDHIFVMGESAGGALAALTGVTGGRKEFDVGDYLSFDSTVCGVVSYYGASAAGNDTPICRPHPNVPDWIMQALLGTAYTEKEYQRFSAYSYLDDSNIPPFLLLHGESDSLVPREQSDQLYEALAERQIPVDYIVVRNAEHGDDLLYQTPVKERILAFMNRVCYHIIGTN